MAKAKAKIIPIRENICIEPLAGKSPQVIELLKDLLAQAKRGEISGIMVGICYPNDTIGRKWAVGECSCRQMLAGALYAYKEAEDLWLYGGEEE